MDELQQALATLIGRLQLLGYFGGLVVLVTVGVLYLRSRAEAE